MKPKNLTDKKKVFISHGMVTHPIGAKCKFCDKVQKEFEQDLKSGKVAKMLKKYKPKNFYDLPDYKRKIIMETAYNEALEKQEELVDKYEKINKPDE